MQKAQTKSKSGRKSKNKKSETPKREDEIKRKAELEAKIRRRVSLEEKAFRIVEQLLENPITEEFLITAAQSIDPNHYADVVEERAIIKHCGYPLCTKPLTDVPKQKYHISTKTNRVYDITERKNFCSGQCYKASKYFEKQLSATPVWLRDDEPPVTIQLLNIASNKGSLGEVVFISPRSELKEELDKLESTDAEFVGKKPPTGQQVNTGSEGRDLDDRRQGRPAPDVSEKRTEPAADSSGDVKKQRETAFTDGGDEDSREDSDTKRADPVTSDPPSDSLLLEDVARDMSGLCLERSLDNLRRLHATDLGEEEEEEEASSPGSDRIRKEGGPVPQPDGGQAGIRPGSESSDRPADLMEPLSIGIPPTDLFDLGQPGGQPGATADPGVWIPGDGGSGRTTSVPDLAPGNSKDVAARVERGSGRRPGSPLSAGSDPEAGQNGIRTLVTAPNAAAAKSRAIREMPKRYEPNRDAGPGSEKETPASQEPAVGDRGVKAKAVAESTALAKARVLSELLDRRDALLRIQEAKHRQDKAVATPSGGQASSRSLGLLQLIEDCTADPDEGQSGGDAKSSSEDRSDPDVGPRSAGQLDPDASKRDPAGRPSGPNRRASAKTAARILANIRRASEQRKRLPDVSAPRSPPGGRGGRRTAAGGKEAKAPRAVVLELIRRTLLDWKTAETARFLTGRRTPTADGPRYGQYAAYNRMFVGREYSGLVGDELDDDDDDDGGGGGGPRGKLPDISRLRADQIYAARVMEFYGLTSREKSARRQTDSDQREEGGTDRVADEEVFLPLVDSHSQMSHRRKIVLDKLGKVFPDLLGPLKVPVSEVSTELRTLVHTFNLTSTNIVLKPAEWTLIAYFLLHLLTLCCPDLRRSMQTEVATHYFKTMLLSVNITSSDVQAITDMMSSLP